MSALVTARVLVADLKVIQHWSNHSCFSLVEAVRRAGYSTRAWQRSSTHPTLFRKFSASNAAVGRAASGGTSAEPQADAQETILNEVTVLYSRGLPVVTAPLPSRAEKCQFTLLPVSNTVGDFLHMLSVEDKGIDRAAIYSVDGIRISSQTTVEALMEHDFDLIINDVKYRVHTPEKERLSQEELTNLSQLRNLIASLYEGLQIDQHQLQKERQLLAKLETIQRDLAPLEKRNLDMARKSSGQTTVLTWLGLGFMAVQFGILARLTWWEYSWDIMEPVTYFVTYGTAMAAYAYFVLTRQEYLLPDARDRQFLNFFHKYAKRYGLDVEKYNTLQQERSAVEAELLRLRDPLQLKLAPKTLEAPLPADFPRDILSPVRRELLSPGKQADTGSG